MKNIALKLIKILIPVLLIPMFLTSCSGVKSVTAPPINKAVVPNVYTKAKVQSPIAEQQDKHIKEKVVESWEEYEASNLPLISALPEKNIFLYGIKPNGVVLYIEGEGHYFNWDYLTPRFVLPEMNVGDYDHDGHDELSIILYVGSGTGCAIEELHIIELSEKQFRSEEPSNNDFLLPNPEYFKDNFFKPEDYLNQIGRHVSLKTYLKKGVLMANITADKHSYVVNLKHLQSYHDKTIVNYDAGFGDIVYFQSKDNKLTIQFALGVTNKLYGSPDFIGDVYGDVNYKSGRFTLSNLRFELPKE